MSPLLLFAPGAGAPSTSAWMVGWAARLAEHGVVETFDYPYQRAGKKLPDRLERLIEAHREALAEARAHLGAEGGAAPLDIPRQGHAPGPAGPGNVGSDSGFRRSAGAHLGAEGGAAPLDIPRQGHAPAGRGNVSSDGGSPRSAGARYPERPVALVGKSMGGRVGCHVSLVELGVVAVVCFGYPLVSRSGALRDEVLRELRVPTLFVQGDRDPLCPLDALEVARAAMKAPSRLHVVAGGDHSLQVTRAEARRLGQSERDASVSTAVGAFLAEVASGMLAPVTESPAP